MSSFSLQSFFSLSLSLSLALLDHSVAPFLCVPHHSWFIIHHLLRRLLNPALADLFLPFFVEVLVYFLCSLLSTISPDSPSLLHYALSCRLPFFFSLVLPFLITHSPTLFPFWHCFFSFFCFVWLTSPRSSYIFFSNRKKNIYNNCAYKHFFLSFFKQPPPDPKK